jgi:hypothetical protein
MPAGWRRSCARGLSVERSVDRKLKRALEVANKMGARFALILGDNEIAEQRYLLKDMSSAEQESLTRGELVATDSKNKWNQYLSIFWANCAARIPAGNCARPMPANAPS